MKTTFRRVFIPIAVILLSASLLVGVSFQFLARRYMRRWAMDNLKNEAKALAEISAAYFAEDWITSREFYMTLQVSNESTGADAVICDHQGKLVLCSDAPQGCEHTGLAVDQTFLHRVMTRGYQESMGVVRGLYREQRYVVSTAIYNSQGQAMGIVIVSVPTTYTRNMLRNMTQTYLVVAVLVVLVAVLVVAYVARVISRPLREVAGAARDFGHGKLDARVRVEPRSPVEVQELSNSFNVMAESLQKSELRRQEFVSNVSHELKTPMTTIGGYVDGMLDGTIPPEHQEKYMRLVSEETKRLSRLVRSMLEVSRLQSQESFPAEQKSRFDACECAGRVLVSFEQKIVEKNIQVEVDFPEDPAYTFAGEDAIIQVLYNLVDNAVKFCPENGALRLAARTHGKKILISVENDGPTIPQEELPLIFDRFHKTDKSRSRAKEGWGLGLYITRQLLLSHGEDIFVVSRDGKTKFTFTLPYIR